MQPLVKYFEEGRSELSDLDMKCLSIRAADVSARKCLCPEDTVHQLVVLSVICQPCGIEVPLL